MSPDLILIAIVAIIVIVAASSALLVYARWKEREEFDNFISTTLSPKQDDERRIRVKNEDDDTKKQLKRAGDFLISLGLFSTTNLDKIRNSIQLAGIRDNTAYKLFIGSKLALCVGIPFVIAMVGIGIHVKPTHLIIACVGGAIFGILAPELYVKNLREKYKVEVRAGIPDALDLLVVCVDAGLAIETAILRVCDEMTTDYPKMANELFTTSQELKMNVSIGDALRNMASRLDIEEITKLATTLSQSMAYGTPISTSLRALASEIRQRTLIEFEEKAAKLSTKMTVPMILFILPGMILMIIGPAIGGVIASLGQLK